MKEHQTPRKDLSHRRSKDSPSSKSIPDHIKKTPKVAKKSLNAEFTPVSEDLLTESVSESLNFSPISELLSENHNGESNDGSEWLFPADNSLFPAIEESQTPSDSAVSSKITTKDNESCDLSVDQCKVSGLNYTVEAEMVANHLTQARVQVLCSNDIHHGSKKLLDALVEVSLKELHALPNDDNKSDVYIYRRSRILVFYFAVWLVISLSMIFYSGGSCTRSSASFYPHPT